MAPQHIRQGIITKAQDYVRFALYQDVLTSDLVTIVWRVSCVQVSLTTRLAKLRRRSRLNFLYVCREKHLAARYCILPN